jgi:hypothetical protein
MTREIDVANRELQDGEGYDDWSAIVFQRKISRRKRKRERKHEENVREHARATRRMRRKR